jgi:NAD(P)-dependent dehydrogenase (short-subunit alcohol dehydrogenase family)
LTIGLSNALAGSTIKVNSMCPGWVQITLAGRDPATAPTKADEAAKAIAEAALPDAAGHSGEFCDPAEKVG